MNQIKTIFTSNHSSNKHFVQKELSNCTHVFLRDDSVRAPFEQPYDGPFEIIKKNDKNFDIRVNGRLVTVSIDRLKAAILYKDTNNETNSKNCIIKNSIKENIVSHDEATNSSNVNSVPTEVRTRSGRLIKKPNRFVTFST